MQFSATNIPLLASIIILYSTSSPSTEYNERRHHIIRQMACMYRRNAGKCVAVECDASLVNISIYEMIIPVRFSSMMSMMLSDNDWPEITI